MTTSTRPTPRIDLLVADRWADYELLDSGAGAKLERFGPYRFVRPEGGAMWQRALPEREWAAAEGVFATADEEGAGRWEFRRPVDARWAMRYGELRFWAQPTAFRHLGVFPEQASQWDWMGGLIRAAQGRAAHGPIKVLNLFGYTGLATLAAAAAGASVTHVDASQRTVAWARENQALSGLAGRPIRWLIDDALKFVRREVRREARYDGLIIDPPKFGRGPKGELWKLEESLPELLDACRLLLSAQPLFLILTVYAIRASAVGLRYLLEPVVAGHGGTIEVGEMGVAERGAGRVLSSAIYSRWSS